MSLAGGTAAHIACGFLSLAALGADLRAYADDALPSFARRKPRMLDADQKSEGTFVTAVPLASYDSSTGVGLGAGGYLYLNGPKSSPLFAFTPYGQRFFLQVFATTGGYQQHQITYDALYLGGTPFSVRLNAGFERNTNANYFGVGERTLGEPSFGGRSFTRLSDQQEAASAVVGEVEASPKYNQFDAITPVVSATVSADLAGGIVRVNTGLIMQHTSVSLYDGKSVEAESRGRTIHAIEGPTLLGQDCAAGLVLGCHGGWDNRLKLAIALDTRDFEPDPNSGVFIDTAGEWSAHAFGSLEDYVRVTTTARFYWSPIPKITDLVLAARLLYSLSTSRVPFFSMHTLAMSEQDQEGLGGENTLRGFRQDRFVGVAAAMANLEVRWTFWKFAIQKERFSLQVAPFFDVGRVFDKPTFAFDHFQPDGGAGLHIAWDQSTILRFDAGFSKEDYGLYIDFGMPF